MKAKRNRKYSKESIWLRENIEEEKKMTDNKMPTAGNKLLKYSLNIQQNGKQKWQSE